MDEKKKDRLITHGAAVLYSVVVGTFGCIGLFVILFITAAMSGSDFPGTLYLLMCGLAYVGFYWAYIRDPNSK